MNAKEYLNRNGFYQGTTLFYVANGEHGKAPFDEVMESYHHHKLSEITEEEIEKRLVEYEDCVLMYIDGTNAGTGDEYDGEDLIKDRGKIAKVITNLLKEE